MPDTTTHPIDRVPAHHPAAGRARAYAAFLSYARTPDAALAVALQRELERFAKPWNQRRALRVFRDDTNLTANSDLWSSITAALDDSDFFILLASPEAARSDWVRQEVEHWLRRRPPDTLLIAVTGGEIAWSATGADREHTTCLPGPLLDAYTAEPRWVDLRALRGGPTPDLRVPAFRDAVVDLAAPLRRLPKDELIGEDLRQFRRTRRLVRVAIGVLSMLTLVASGAAVVAVQQTSVAEQQRAEAVHQQRAAVGRELLTRAEAVRDTDPRSALRLALAARAVDPGPPADASLVRTVTENRIEATLSTPGDTVRSVAFSPDARYLGIVGTGGALSLWNVSEPSGPVRMGEVSPDDVQAVDLEFAPDGRALAVARADGTVLVLHLVDGRATGADELAAHDDAIFAVTFAPDGRTMATAGFDDTIKLWEVPDAGAPRQLGPTLTRHRGDVFGLAFSPDGRLLASGGADRSVIIWDVRDPAGATPVGAPLSTGDRPGVSVRFDSSGQLLAVGDGDRTQLYDVSTPARPRLRPGEIRSPFNSSFITTFGAERTVAAATADGTVQLWDAGGPGEPALRETLTGHSDSVTALAFTPVGELLASGGEDGTVIIWRLPDQSRPGLVGRLPSDAQRVGLAAVALAPTGGLAALSDGDHRISLWDVRDPRRPTRYPGGLSGHRDVIWSTAFAPDGKTLASTGFDRTVRLWDVGTPGAAGPLGPALEGHRGRVLTSAFSPDGRTLATSDEEQTVILWDVADPRRARQRSSWETRSRVGVLALSYSPDGRTLATNSAHDVELWDVTDPDRPQALGEPVPAHLDDVETLAFAPDGRTLATGAGDGNVILWDLADRERPRMIGAPLLGAAGPRAADGRRTVHRVAFTPDGDTLAAVDGDGGVQLWDVRDRGRPTPLGQRFASPDQLLVLSAQFTADGRALVLPGADTGYLWDVGALLDRRAGALDRACAVAGRGLTPEEWAADLPGIDYAPTCP